MANIIITGFLGGMGGCAVIGQTMITLKGSGARSRVSTFLAGVFLLVLVVTQFNYARDAEPHIDKVVIDPCASHLWDASTIAVLDTVTEKYRRHGLEVELTSLNSAGIQMRERLAGKLNAGE